MALNEERVERYLTPGYELVGFDDATAVVICDGEECEADLSALIIEGGGQEFLECKLDVLTAGARDQVRMRVLINPMWCPGCRKRAEEERQRAAEARREATRPARPALTQDDPPAAEIE